MDMDFSGGCVLDVGLGVDGFVEIGIGGGGFVYIGFG